MSGWGSNPWSSDSWGDVLHKLIGNLTSVMWNEIAGRLKTTPTKSQLYSEKAGRLLVLPRAGNDMWEG